MNGRFRFAPDILRRLGEELNPSPDQSIVELVKNAYDADAHTCRVELTNVDQLSGSVRVSDDGEGMNADDIESGWLVLGRSPKTPGQPSTRLGRHPAGSKGLGRLAALRMGSRARLTTRPRREPTAEYVLSIDWHEFDEVKVVDEVVLPIERRQRPPSAEHGTEILLEDLRHPVNRGDVRKLARSLILLADPFSADPSGFRPVLAAREFKDLERFVESRYFADADYHLVAKLDSAGRASARVVDFKGEELFGAAHSDLAAKRDNQPYRCPAIEFDLWVFILTATAFQLRTSTLTEVRDWLRAFGGVHVYQNGIRVAPYGNPGNDWLDMNLRRVRSPEERPGTNTSIGRVSITGGEEELPQKTDRSGFIETPAFGELRTFAQDAMEWMARRRMELADARRAQERAESRQRARQASRGIEAAISKAPASARKEIEQAFGAYERSRDREVSQLRKEVQLYRTLSTAGITAATFAHESSGNPIKVITLSIRTIERRGKQELGSRYQQILEAPVCAILHATDSLSVLGTATLSLIDHQKRRLGRVSIHDVVKEVLKMFEPFLAGREVSTSTEWADGHPYLRASQAALESIVTNLLNNSLAAFERKSVAKRAIRIRTDLKDTVLVLSVADNGPGIEGIAVADIWLPGETTRPNGTGLGLTIVRDTVRDLGGRVDALSHSDLGGAEILVELPILGR